MPIRSPLVKLSAQEVLKRGVMQAVTQWTPGIKPTWTIKEVRHALRLHALGNFSLSALLVDTMGEDDSIPGLLEKLVDAVLLNDFCLDEVESEDTKLRKLSEQLAEDLGPLWWDMYPEAELDELFRWYEMLGVGLAVLDWDKSDPNFWKPVLRVLHPQFLWWDATQEKWFYTAREGVLEVIPGNGTWVLLTDGHRGWMRGKVRAAGIPWIGKQLTIRDQGRYNERHGFPIILARTPAIADEGDRDQFWEDLQGLASEAMVELPTCVGGEDPQGKLDPEVRYDLELLEAKDTSHEAFGATLDRWDRRLTILFLGANQNTEVSQNTGTNASARQHKDELVDKAKGIEKRTTTQLRKQALWPVVAFNYDGAVFDATPWPHWDVDPPEDTKAEADGQKSFGEAMKAVQNAGFDIENVDEIAEKHGLKLAKRAAPPPTQTPPGAPKNPAAPASDPNPPEGDEEEEDPAAPTDHVHVLASGASPVTNSGFVEGQLYVDALVERSTGTASQALKPTLDAIVEELNAAKDYDDLRNRLRIRFEKLSAEDLSELVYRSMMLAELAGRRAVTQDG